MLHLQQRYLLFSWGEVKEPKGRLSSGGILQCSFCGGEGVARGLPGLSQSVALYFLEGGANVET